MNCFIFKLHGQIHVTINMMKHEFEALVNKKVTDKEFEIIRMAYNHPKMQDHDKIANLYNLCGMMCMWALAPVGALDITCHNAILSMPTSEKKSFIIKACKEKRMKMEQQIEEFMPNALMIIDKQIPHAFDLDQIKFDPEKIAKLKTI